MPLYQIILNYINALKWPVLAGILVYYFRGQLVGLAQHIATSDKGSVSGLGVKISWERTLRQAATDVQHVRKELPPVGISPPQITLEDIEWKSIEELTSTNPAAAVLMAWLQIELALRTRAERFNIPLNRRTAGTRLIFVTKLPKDLQTSVAGLASLRNAVAHGEDRPNIQEARSYVQIARDLQDAVTRAPATD